MLKTCKMKQTLSPTCFINFELKHHLLCTEANVQWSLYFKTTHRTKKMWSYIAGGLKGHLIQRIALWEQIKQSYNQGWS